MSTTQDLSKQVEHSTAAVTVGFVLIFALAGVLALASFQGLLAMKGGIAALVRQYDSRTSALHQLRDLARQRLAVVRDVLIEPDPFLRDELLAKFRTLGREFGTTLTAMEQQAVGPAEAAELTAIRQHAGLSGELRARIDGLVFVKVSTAEKQALVREAEARHQELFAKMDKLLALQNIQVRESMAASELQFRQSLVYFFTLLIMITMLAIAIAIWVRRTVKDKNARLLHATLNKSMLLATMSHEIRTPLTSIIGFGETLLDTDTTKTERIAAIQTIVRNGRHLQQVINDVLDYSKLETMQLELRSERVSLKECLCDLDVMLRRRAEEAGLQFVIKVEQLLPETIESDTIKLKQVLINLLGNAIKFTREGEVRLLVEIDEPHGMAHFHIIDSGVGMSEQQQRQLFLPYEQLGDYNRGQGTGLGLYISKQMAQIMGGDLTATSELGVGSHFTLSVPTGDLTGVPRIQWSGAVFEAVKGALNRAIQLSGNVLLAEDREDNQQLFSIYLGKAGVNLTIVANGREALDEALHGDYSLVLMDMQMPVMDGVTATRELRRMGYTRPIIALTANVGDDIRQQCLEVGFDDFLTKPISRADFLEVLTHYLAVSRREEQAEQAPIYSRLLEEEPDLRPAVEYFIGNLGQLYRQIREAGDGQDWAALKELVHDLKGTAGGVGYPGLTQLAMEVEFALAKEDAREVGYLIDLMATQVERIQCGYALQQGGQDQPAAH